MSLPSSLQVPLAESAFISVLDLLKPGIRPSNSHAVSLLRAASLLDMAVVAQIECTVFGSLVAR